MESKIVVTSSDMRWTSVTSHQAHAHPPTMVVLVLAPQQPPVNYNSIKIKSSEN